MEKSQSSKNLLGKIRGLFSLEERLTVNPRSSILRSAPPQSLQPNSHPPQQEFWKPTITGRLQPDLQELVIYFNVLRSESRAYKTQQMIQRAGGKAEVLRLVGWEFYQPHVTITVKATDTGNWKCQQHEAAGKREPYGYVVMSSVFRVGLVNSLTIPHRQLKNHSLRFQLDDRSQWTRIN
ncbi:MAG: hypothetical protein WCA07_06610 [Gloeobacterales cyanobacterium]